MMMTSTVLDDSQAMRDGKYEAGKAVLRLKVDMFSPNPTMWDPIAYRIKVCRASLPLFC